MLLFIKRSFFSKATGCISPTRCKSTSFKFGMVFKWEKILFFFPLRGNLIGWKFENSHLHVVFFGFQLICLQNERLDSFQQRFNGQIHLCIKLLDKRIAKYVPKLFSTSLDYQDLQDSFKFSENVSEKHLGLSILLRSSDTAIMRWVVEINAGIEICGTPLKSRFFQFFQLYAKVDQKFYNSAKNMLMPAGHLVDCS